MIYREYYQKMSKETRQRILVWVGIQRYLVWLTSDSTLNCFRHNNTSWHWLGEDTNISHNPTVTNYNWGFSEPSEGGECVVMDSSMRWSWNAVRCVISGHVSCHGSPQWCPAPPLLPTVTHNQLETNQFIDGTIINLDCQEGFESKSGQKVSIKCEKGFWNQYSLFCIPVDCGYLSEDKLNVFYLNKTTTYLSLAKVSCKKDNSSLAVTLQCKRVSLKITNQLKVNRITNLFRMDGVEIFQLVDWMKNSDLGTWIWRISSLWTKKMILWLSWSIIQSLAC